jgi:hypothetical protein
LNFGDGFEGDVEGTLVDIIKSVDVKDIEMLNDFEISA